MKELTLKELFTLLTSIARSGGTDDITPYPPLSQNRCNIRDMYYRMKQDGSFKGTWNEFQHKMKDRSKK